MMRESEEGKRGGGNGDADKREAGSGDADEGEERSVGGEETAAERVIGRYVGDATHLFLSLLAVLILIAAALAAYDTVIRVFPKLLVPSDEYKVLAEIISNILLIAIAAELSLLLLFHRTSAAVEVILFVIARKIVNPEISALDLMLSVAALAGLLIVRFHYLPGKPK